ncbi:peptidylprolyl isomerase [Tindallia californiensis]|uniref:Peptidyl-prolyl cis-trans isomerase C n=1 Tax=Tindallia californiensis TaxID=159292 RepID=A0A1H3J567_9FIRM|nr:peptidylprolyl isomerase [Tindallia californiensis]SDY34689.1 peptidyl-prolyl cis-trans isomerase C [Tindallia californiensis]
MDQKQVLAIVEGREITQEDLELVIQSLNPQQANQFQTEDGKKRLLQELVNQELIYLDAVENGVESNLDYQRALKKMKDNFLKQYAMNAMFQKAEVSEEEIEQFYKDHPEQFQQPAQTKASHILVDDEDAAIKIKNELNEGASFEEKAKEASGCPSSQKGGDLGYFPKGKMVPEFEEAAMELNPGEISEPVKTQFGFHIIKVVDRKEGSTSKLEDVKDQLQQHLAAQKQQSIYLETVNSLKDKYKVEIK